MDKLFHPTFSDPAYNTSCILGIVTWADNRYDGKHDFVEEFIEVITITVTGFTAALGELKYLPISKFLLNIQLNYLLSVTL